MDGLRQVKVELRSRRAEGPAEALVAELAQARQGLLRARKQLRAAAAAAQDTEGMPPRRWRLAMLVRFASRHSQGVSSHPATQRLAEAQEAARLAQERVETLEAQLVEAEFAAAPVARHA